jgi:hypothetical protein
VTEFVSHRKTGIIVPTLDPKALAQGVLTAIEDTKLAARLRVAARQFAEQHLDLNEYLMRYRACIEDIAGRPLLTPKPVVKPAKKPAKTAANAAKPAPKPVAKRPERRTEKPVIAEIEKPVSKPSRRAA